MNRRLLHTIFITALVNFCTIIPASAQKQDVVIRVSQDESSAILSEFQTSLQLKKKAFKFIVMLENTKGVYVFASIRDSIYRFTETSPIRDFVYLPLLELREDEYNQNKELNISEDGWSYWFYDTSIAWHPFHHKIVGLGNGRVACTKVIKQFYDVADRSIIKIRDINQPLYLFFVAVAEYDANGNPSKELLRRKIKIEWSNED
jgi:hypothetical protein